MSAEKQPENRRAPRVKLAGTVLALLRLESGRQITWLSRHLGHSSLSVTTEVYGHWERAERKREMALMEGVFGV